MPYDSAVSTRSEPLSERAKLSVAAAADTAKAVLTLSTAILSFTVAFRNDIASDATRSDEMWLWLTWILLLIGITGGVFTLLALARVIGRTTESVSNYNRWVRFPTGVQVGGFLAGL